MRRLLPLLVLLTLAACDEASPTPAPTAPYQWHGASFVRPVSKPDIHLTDQNGAAYSMAAKTQGKLTLIYFGYTHCPDECPTAMATVALAVRSLTPAERERIAVLFITTDPARDTSAVLKTWLANFDPTFVGLTGTNDQIRIAQGQAHMPDVATPESPHTDGSYAVEHDAFLVAFSPDGLGHISYPGGVHAADEAADFHELLSSGWHDPVLPSGTAPA